MDCNGSSCSEDRRDELGLQSGNWESWMTGDMWERYNASKLASRGRWEELSPYAAPPEEGPVEISCDNIVPRNREGASSLGERAAGDAQRDYEMNRLRLTKVMIKLLNSRILKGSYLARGVRASSQIP